MMFDSNNYGGTRNTNLFLEPVFFSNTQSIIHNEKSNSNEHNVLVLVLVS